MNDRLKPDWKQKVKTRITELAGNGPSQKNMAEANVGMITRATHGLGPDKPTPVPQLGARMAVNIASVHVPSFCKPPNAGKAYKNYYDLRTDQKDKRTLGKPDSQIPVRVKVDAALSKITGFSQEDMYFGAVELNGSGIRFYGDVCFILKPEVIAPLTIILWSNSYDLIRPPLTIDPVAADVLSLSNAANEIWGNWAPDVGQMAALKTMAVRFVTERRLTTGQISDAVLEDEDYLEILKQNSFSAGDLLEARTAASDVSAETAISDNLRLGPCPTLAELHWRKHRRAASDALHNENVPIRVVTTKGRVR